MCVRRLTQSFGIPEASPLYLLSILNPGQSVGVIAAGCNYVAVHVRIVIRRYDRLAKANAAARRINEGSSTKFLTKSRFKRLPHRRDTRR